MKRIIQLALVFCLAAPAAYAFKLSPMVANFTAKGDGKTQSFFVENTSDKKVAVQIDVLFRTQNSAGEEERTETDKFTVYPPQIILKPKQKRTIRVSWTGPQKVEEEQAFRLVAEELPIELQRKQENQRTNINFLMKYVASLYVTPPSARAKVEVASVEAKTMKVEVPIVKEKMLKGKKVKIKEKKMVKKRMMAISLENKGNAHKVLNEIQIEASSSGKKIKISQESLQVFATENLLAKGKKTFHVPWPKGLSEKNVQLSVSFIDNLGKKSK